MAFPEAKLRLGPIFFVMIISKRVWAMPLRTVLLARKSEMSAFQILKGTLDKGSSINDVTPEGEGGGTPKR